MLENTNTKQTYPGPILNTTLQISTFLFKDPEQVKLTKTYTNDEGIQVEENLTYGTDYEVTKTLADDISAADASLTASVGEILLKPTVSVLAGQKLTAYRESELTQEVSYPRTGPFPAKTHEGALDYLTMQNQEQQEQIDRSLKVPVSTGPFNASMPIPIAARALKINSEGTGFEMSEYDPDTALVTTEEFKKAAQEAAASALVSKNTAESMAESASTSASSASASQTAANASASAAANSASSASDSQTAASSSASAAATILTETQAVKTAAITELSAIKDSTLQEIETLLDTRFAAALSEAINSLSQTGQAYLQDLTPNQFIQFSDRRQLKILKNTYIPLELLSTGITLWFSNLTDILIQPETLLDTGDTFQNGKAYSIFLVPNEDNTAVELKVSLNSTAPTGYTVGDTRRIGGFHTECVAVGDVTWYTNHPLSGWLAGDILPQSVWTLYHRPYASPNNCIYIPCGRPFWRTIYDHAGTLETTSFEYNGTVTRNRTFYGHFKDLMYAGYGMPTYEQAAISGLGCEELKAIMGKSEAASAQAGGHINESSHRITSIFGAEDCCGVTWKMTTLAAIGGSGWSTDASVGVHQYGSVNILLVGGGWGDSGNAGPFATAGSSSALIAPGGVASFGVSYPLPRKSLANVA